MRLIFGKPPQPAGEPLPLTGIHRILVCYVSHTLGNTLLLTPLIQELEATYPGAEIDILTRRGGASVIYRNYFSVSRIFSLPAHGFGHPIALWRELGAMRRNSYDLVIDPDPQSQTGRLYLLMARAKWKLGFSSRKKTGNLTHAVPFSDAPESKGKSLVFLLRSALGKPASDSWPQPDIRLSAGEQNEGREALARVLATVSSAAGKKGVIGIFANATGDKLLGQDWWTPFLDTLEAAHPDYQLVEIVPMFGRSMLGGRYPTFFSTDLRKLASVLSALNVYISADCGIMHLASATCVPTMGIFTRTKAQEWGVYGGQNHTIYGYDRTPSDIAGEIAGLLPGTGARPVTMPPQTSFARP
ncbi:ADP-heptose:LPS heptosyltransferase [Luteibacter sp. Sphag1AF]|uniref:glycosyltransferase family 9 protein n=1 Tax=Luteibacter sp. Sphag1AF TaxID=2587031 RepID=UPI0016161E38|nr:glycosyltransferase family 9 protein [Luteibacter sp. Sphag1AF]MBB3228109.1 ADP-heptose:LPS heptosyltransferase [Luteibacter sp. Sphag1AF]